MKNRPSFLRCGGCVLVSLLCLGASAAADFTADFQNALRLYEAGKAAEAYAEFAALAARAPTSGSKADALRYAVLSAISARQFGKAEELLAQIPRESTRKLCQMNLLLAQGQTQELARRFQNEDLTEWSDFHIYDALVTRARAYRRLQRYAEAIVDFTKAEAFALTPMKQASLLNQTAGTLLDAGDDGRALAVYRQLEAFATLKGYGITNDAAIGAARILAPRGRYEEALKELDQIPLAKSGYWGARPLMVRAEIVAARGQKAAAIAKYREALAVAPDDLRKSIQASLEKLK